MDVYITDMHDPVVTISQECFDLIEYGNNMKTIATTAMKPQSSRGYTIIKLHMELSTLNHDESDCRVTDCSSHAQCVLTMSDRVMFEADHILK